MLLLSYDIKGQMTYSIADEILSELNIPASMKTIKKIMDNSLEKWFGLNFSRDILYCPYHKTTYTFEKAELDEFPHCLKPKSEALINMYESIESSLAAIVLNKDSMKRINEFRKKTNGREVRSIADLHWKKKEFAMIEEQ